MPAVSVAGAAFVIEVGTPAVQYEDQVTSGTVTTTPTIVRTKTLSSVAFDQTDINSTVSLEFLYDENTGLFDALQTAAAGANTVALVVTGAAGYWSGSSMSIESVETTFAADGIATCSASFTGPLTFT